MASAVVALVEQPLAGADPDRARGLRGERVAQRRLEPGEHRHVGEEVRRRLGPRAGGGAVDADRADGALPAPGEPTRAGRSPGLRTSTARAASPSEGARVGLHAARPAGSPSPAANRQAEPNVQAWSNAARGAERRRRPDDRHHERHPERRPDLAGDRVQAGRGGEALARRRGDRGAAQVGEQRAGADPEHDDSRQPLAEEVRRQARPSRRTTAPLRPRSDRRRRAPAGGRCAAPAGWSARPPRRRRTGPASAPGRPGAPSSATPRSGTGRWSACSRRSRRPRPRSSRWPR